MERARHVINLDLNGADNMIKQINKTDIPECVKVIKESFLTVANEFGFTIENAPRFTAFATTGEHF